MRHSFLFIPSSVKNLFSIKKFLSLILLGFFLIPLLYAENNPVVHEHRLIDRTELVNQQINLLKTRLLRAENEFFNLQKNTTHFTPDVLQKSGKKLLDKASLEISVARSNLDSINIELQDSVQSLHWLEKNIQELTNQLNVLGMFGAKTKNDFVNPNEMQADLKYQKNLLNLEKTRSQYLLSLQNTSRNITQFKYDSYRRLNDLIHSAHLQQLRQQQAKDELLFQEAQNRWLQKLNELYARLAKTDPVDEKDIYTALERDIFYANEEANFAYTESLIARYKDQVEQIRLSLMKSNSISVLHEINEQILSLNKQLDKLESLVKNKVIVLRSHVNNLAIKRKNAPEFQNYLNNLLLIAKNYASGETVLLDIRKNLTLYRARLDKQIQLELSSRQGLPTFDLKTLLNFGKEVLLLPALTFQVIKSLSITLANEVSNTSYLKWFLFILLQAIFFVVYQYANKVLRFYLERLSLSFDTISSKWLTLQFLKRNSIDLGIFLNTLFIFNFFMVPIQQYAIILSLGSVWLIFKAIFTVARLCLVETTHDDSGHDTRLFQRLKWIVIIGGVITALTVFVHQLPFIYELNYLCERLFLLFLMVVSLFLIRSSQVVPNLILTHMELRHPYIQKIVRLMGVLIPILTFLNSLIGLAGFLNLVMTITWYEGIFLVVMVVYLILRSFISDCMELISRLTIQHVNNGWLWTEAFLKPMDKILRISLFILSWLILFLLFRWDYHSSIGTAFNDILHYKLASVFDYPITSITAIKFFVIGSLFYWIARWTREFVYRLLLSRTNDLGIRNSIAILSQYTVIVFGSLFCLSALGISLSALKVVAGMLSLGIGFGLRDLANNFASGFLILLERPIRVGDIVNINNVEGEVVHIGSRAVTVRTWDHMELVVPNTEIFNKSFTNWTAHDNIVRTVLHINIGRHDNPHKVKVIIQQVLTHLKEVLKEPQPEVFLKEMTDICMHFEIRYYVNIRQVKSRTSVGSSVLLSIWDAFAAHEIKPPYPQQEIYLRRELPKILPMEILPGGKEESM